MINEIIKEDKESILKGIKQEVLDYLENMEFYAADDNTFNDFVVLKIKGYLIENFSLNITDVYAIDIELVKYLTGNYYFNKINYSEGYV